ncbi:MAG: hypothetical protein ACK5HY_06155 [Parahaliea sp.]
MRLQVSSGDGPLWVGQRIILAVELLAPGYFTSAANFDLPDPQGVVLMPPTGHPVVDSTTLDGTFYTIQRHELSAWAMREGEQSIPPIHARFTFKRNPLDRETVSAAVVTDAVAIAVSRPPGTGSLGNLISARGLTVEESWEPSPGDEPVTAGSAFQRRIRFSAPDVPGMLFPPFPAGEIDGLGIYRQQSLRDHSDRGSLTGVRSETLTYLCKRPGQYHIPAARFRWFDIDAGIVRTVELPGHTLNVIANPAMASATGEGADAPGSQRRSLALVALVLLAVGLLGIALRRRGGRLLAALRPVRLQPLNPAPGRPLLPAARARQQRRDG